MADSAPRAATFGAALGGVARAAAIPHGYTLTVWTATMTLIARHGLPRTGEIVLFLVGARVAYALLRLGAPNGLRPERDLGASVGQLGAIAAVFVVADACARLPDQAAWPAASFAATLAYFTTVSLRLRVPLRRRAPRLPVVPMSTEEEHSA